MTTSAKAAFILKHTRAQVVRRAYPVPRLYLVFECVLIWWILQDSNLRPTACRAATLPTELKILHGVKWGIEPSLTVSQTAVQPLH